MLENLTKTLSKSQTMIINYRTIGLDGKIKRKRARAYYIDETHENIVIVGRDITDIYEEENKENSEQQGSGLRLAIVKNLVELMDGMISVKSAPGEGSEFIVDLYTYLLSANQDALNKKIGNDYNILKGAKILLVEDNKINAVVATKLLEKEGCIVETCENGVQGFERYKDSSNGYNLSIVGVT